MSCICILTTNFTEQLVGAHYKHQYKSCPSCLQGVIQLSDFFERICDGDSAQIIAGSHKEVSEAASAVLLLAVIVGLCEVSCCG